MSDDTFLAVSKALGAILLVMTPAVAFTSGASIAEARRAHETEEIKRTEIEAELRFIRDGVPPAPWQG